MDHIIITGNEHYTQEEILEASGLKQGDNLYLMNKYSVKEKIFSKLPFVEEVSINRRLPDTLLIDLREC
ncbi:MAG: FtsQ-type POTRA domain-containing protein, partial [Oscillospiraceae bacterium]|nr:FtsQ-type POTRA domain-containing protein [Oscillospiraceae bacterium]